MAQNNTFHITTFAASKSNIIIFIVFLLLIISMLFIFKTYRESLAEIVIIEDEDDVLEAKQVIKDNIRGLEGDLAELEWLVT